MLLGGIVGLPHEGAERFIDTYTHDVITLVLPGALLSGDVVVVGPEQRRSNVMSFEFISPSFSTDYKIENSGNPNYPADIGYSTAGGEQVSDFTCNASDSVFDTIITSLLAQLRLMGSSFDVPGIDVRVTVGGRNCTNVIVLSDTEVTCTTPEGQGTLNDVILYRGAFCVLPIDACGSFKAEASSHVYNMARDFPQVLRCN